MHGIRTCSFEEYHEIKERNAEIGLEKLNVKIDVVSKGMLHDIRLYAETMQANQAKELINSR